MIEKAKKISQEAHKSQIRRFDGSPYFVHPNAVAEIVSKYKTSKHINELVSAAYLHDVIEDCGIQFDFLQREFGHMVASIVVEVTSDYKLLQKYGKRYYMANKVLTLSNYGLVIKLSDRLDNVSDLKNSPKDFRDKYSTDTDYMIQILQDFRNLTPTQLKLIESIKEHI